MTARKLEALLADGEAPATIESAIAALSEIHVTTDRNRRSIANLRAELEAELKAFGKQGSLF
jgi:hypothetical protein